MKLKLKYTKLKYRKIKLKEKILKYKAKNYIYYFQQFQTIRSFDENIYSGKININDTKMDEINLLENIVEFNDKS